MAKAITRRWKNPSLSALPQPKSDIWKWCRISVDRRRLGRPLDPADLLRVGVGGADVVDAR